MAVKKIKIIKYEISSHGRKSSVKIYSQGKMEIELGAEGLYWSLPKNKAEIKMAIWHLQDVLKLIRKIEKNAEGKNKISTHSEDKKNKFGNSL